MKLNALPPEVVLPGPRHVFYKSFSHKLAYGLYLKALEATNKPHLQHSPTFTTTLFGLSNREWYELSAVQKVALHRLVLHFVDNDLLPIELVAAYDDDFYFWRATQELLLDDATDEMDVERMM